MGVNPLLWGMGVWSKTEENKYMNWWYPKGIWFLMLTWWGMGGDYSCTANQNLPVLEESFLAGLTGLICLLPFILESEKNLVLIHCNATSLSSARSKSVIKKVIWLVVYPLWTKWCILRPGCSKFIRDSEPLVTFCLDFLASLKQVSVIGDGISDVYVLYLCFV